MPVISATGFAGSLHVRVSVNWSDYPSVAYARVLRTNTVTGEQMPLRPYVAYSGDYLMLSCGQAIFWDTEVPLDVAVTYTTEALDGPCDPNPVSCLACIPVTATSGTVTVDSAGNFYLTDPVRPCRDLTMPMCFTSPADPGCIPGSGLFFASMEAESRQANSIVVNPTNASAPLMMSRARRKIDSTLTLVSRTFADRDNVIEINEPGTPLLLRGPADYGINDTYMGVGDVGVSRGLSDHKIQPRIITLPFVTVDRPAGPTQAPCDLQVDNLCATYPTWNAMAAAGTTWLNLLQGAGGVVAGRTWDEVEVEFANWTAVDNGTRTWDDLAAGA